MLHSQTKPTLATSKVWSAADMYEFVPVDATWAGGVVTLTFNNHQLTNGDSVNLVCLDATNGWNAGTVVATVIDKNTFSVPIAVDPGYFPNAQPYYQDNTVKRVIVKVPKYSKMFYLQNYIQVDSVGSITGMKLQYKLNEEASWIDAAAPLASITTAGVYKMADMYNFMRLVAAGADTTTLPVVYTQKNYTV